MEEKRKRRSFFALLLGLVGLALLGALWAWRAREGCGACGAARDLSGGGSLAPVGAVTYAILLASGALFGPSRFLFGGLLLAAGVHLALFLVLVQRGVFCAPCILTGLAAIVAAVLSFVIDPTNLARAGFLIPAGAVAAPMALFWAGGIMTPTLARSNHALYEAPSLREHPARSGGVRMTVYGRAGCPYCVELEEHVIPELRREFGERLDVFGEEAPAGIPTPTIVIGGAKGTVFPGLPPIEDLKTALRSAIEGERHEQALPPESR
jgi:hypothetical protein